MSDVQTPALPCPGSLGHGGAGPRPRHVEFYCKAGGTARGLMDAGFHVTGVDIDPQPNFCGDEFIQADALELLSDPNFLARFDSIGAAPPCQSESDLRFRTGVEYEDLLTPTLALLQHVEQPWVVENVASTKKLPGSLILCGTEFDLKARCRDGKVRWLRRHRRFATSFLVMGAGGCHCSRLPIGGVYGTGGGGQQNRGYKFRPAEAREAMGIDWMSWAELGQAIPPAYARHIGEALMAHLTQGAAA